MSETTLERADQADGSWKEPTSRWTKVSLGEVVPADPWYTVRLIGFAAFTVGYIIFFVQKGLIIDRISVGISVVIFIVIGHLGRPARRWAWLVFDTLCYCVMWFVYDESRGWADKAGFETQVYAMRNIDRFLFFGKDPSAFLQEHWYDPKHVHWYDKVMSATYFTHFIFPIIAIAVLWVTSHREWARFMKRFASLLFVACAMFIVLPTAPPWMVSSKYHALYRTLPDGVKTILARHTGRGFSALGLKGFTHSWESALDWGNAIAAMPSLHASFALFVPAFFLPRIRWKWLKALVLCFPVLMLTSLVYFGEHWIIDGLVGWALVGLSFLFWGWQERTARRKKADRARQHFGFEPPADADAAPADGVDVPPTTTVPALA
ncbi:MAG: hypothetical protein JWM34_306 [Ilumatobacteraceae bacterium]|nr:hypothetical protein [Ilumatobacteraceae bacterium]